MFLEEILQYKYAEVAIRKEQVSILELERKLSNAPPIRPFRQSLTGDSIKLIAELKKASPSKGLLCPDFDPVNLARIYEASRAAAISVLTDNKFFQGSLDYLKLVKAVTKRIPILRKDFIIDRYQLYEARVHGADAALLIVAALKELELKNFIKEAKDLGLAPLVEVHNATELKIALESGADLIGINNRDLKTFKVDLETTFQLIESIPKDKVVVSESGIANRHDIELLAQAGVNGVLVGESIVTAADPGAKIEELSIMK
ncbi:MAG: indole-3-glycerol phosphate synthase TrpC [Firmicutes bacterium]|nr:indole-3-glycerol phosphate synthase TrpC [Bacillota bacterium]